MKVHFAEEVEVNGHCQVSERTWDKVIVHALMLVTYKSALEPPSLSLVLLLSFLDTVDNHHNHLHLETMYLLLLST